MTTRRKVRPCKLDCSYPAKKGKQFCHWHWLMRQSSDVQAFHASSRRGGVDVGVARVPKEKWPEGERWCSGCQSFVPLFYCSGSQCRACKSAAAHAGRLEKTYGITAREYDALLRKQGGRCAICQSRPRTTRFAVDHDHKTGDNRGILCKRCNHDLLGGGHDDPKMLWRAITYLLYPPAQTDRKPSDEEVFTALQLALRAGPITNSILRSNDPCPF